MMQSMCFYVAGRSGAGREVEGTLDGSARWRMRLLEEVAERRRRPAQDRPMQSRRTVAPKISHPPPRTVVFATKRRPVSAARRQ